MKVIVDENIAFASEAFSDFGDVQLMHGRKIDKHTLADADALIVRSITNVNKDLLEGSNIRFVGTATIGTDHIDTRYLKDKGIVFQDAKGCNADAVAEYVFTAVSNLAVKHNIKLEEKTIGVVGVGNIGSRIVRLADSLGMKVLKNDPPLQRKSQDAGFVSLDEILSADIITLHVPLNKGGIDNTDHLFDRKIISRLKEGAILVNASRGQVVDNAVLLELLEENKLHVVLDVWENEPDINVDLLEKVELGTPHIAGYSLEGKVNGTLMMYNALADFCSIARSWQPAMPSTYNSQITLNPTGELTADLEKIFNIIYKIRRDDKDLRKLTWMQEAEKSAHFDLLRKNYPLRREFLNYHVKLNREDERLNSVLRNFRIKII